MSDENLEQQPTTEAPTGGEGGGSSPAPETSWEDTLWESAQEIKAREPNRGEDGRFQPKVVAQGAPEGVQVPGSPQAAPPNPVPPVIEAPQSLPADVKAHWSTLPPDVQKYWSNREGEIHKKLTTDGERIKALSAYEEAIAPFQEMIQKSGRASTQYITDVLRTEQAIGTNPVAAVQYLLNKYGIDPRSLAFGSPGQQPQAMPPNNSAFDPRIDELKSRQDALEKQQQDALTRAAQERIDGWSKDKPYFKDVEATMTKLYEPGMDLDKLYEDACQANGEVRAKIEADRKAEADKKAAEEAAEKAKKDARIAPFARRPGSAPTQAPKGDWTDTMRQVQQEIRSRA